MVMKIVFCWAQTTNPPPILHREITWAGQAPEGPAVFQNNPNFVGEGNLTTQIQSGEDWWYDTETIYENGIHAGYIVVGFTTYKNMFFSEHEFNPPGFLNELSPGLNLGDQGFDDCSRLINYGESVSGYRQVVARFNLKGEMVWCKPLNYDNALRSVIQSADGTFYAIGETGAAYQYGSNPIPYKYNPNSSATNILPLVLKVNPISPNDPYPKRYNRTRIVVYHFDSNGNVLWSHLYGQEIFLDPVNQAMKDANSTVLENLHLYGIDLQLNTAGDLLIAGQITDGRIFTAKINPISGYLLAKNEIQIPSKFHWVKKLDCNSLGECFIVGGTGTNGQQQSFIYKFDENSLVSLPQTNNPKYYDLNINQTPNPSSAFMNVVAEPDGSLITVGIEKTSDASFYAGSNAGIGRICKIDALGNIVANNMFADLKAFDMKIGLLKTASQDYAVLSTVPGDFDFSNQNQSLQQILQSYKSSVQPSVCSDNFKVEFTWNTDTYVAKFDQNLTKIWETRFDSDDKEPTHFPGDIKKQECMYSIAEAADGKLFVVGNASPNSDDYFAALLESDCQQNVTYDFPMASPNQVVPNEFSILPNTTVVWNSPKKVKGIIRVHENGLLRIENTFVEIANSETVGMATKFIVERGGRLEIINSTLTCVQSCGNQFWDGIAVFGEKSANQTNVNQGSVFISNATIEHAKEALIPGDYYNWNVNGGIITAINCSFINNNRSVQYLPYQNKTTPTAAETNNLGTFTNCTFSWTNEFLLNAPQPAITMCGTKGIRLLGCTFDDKRSGTIPLANRAKGIFSLDAGYLVNGKVISGLPPTHDYYSTSNYDVGEFINMFKGIENLNSGSLKPFVVDHVRFVNCHEGIIVSGTDNVIVTRNEFNFSDNSAPYFKPNLLPFGKRRELSITRSTAYKIEGNHFYNDFGEYSYGCNIDNSGIEENEIRKNKFSNQHYASFGQKRNRNNDNINSKGLQFLCNTNTNNFYDFTNLSTTPLEGVKLSQGSPSQATLNSVSQNLPQTAVNFKTNDVVNLDYYYSGSIDSPIFFGAVNPVLAQVIEGCPSKLNIFELDLPNKIVAEGVRENLENLLEAALAEKENHQAEYEVMLENGNLASLHNSISTLSTSEAAAVYSALLNASPYLSFTIMMELGEVPNSIFSNAWYMDLLLQNAELLEDLSFRNFLTTKTEPLSETELEGILSETNVIITERGKDRAEIGVYTNEIEQLRNTILVDFLVSDELADQAELPNLLVERDHYAKTAELIDYYFGNKDFNQTLIGVNNLQNEINNLAYSPQTTELIDFVTVKSFLLNKVVANEAYYSTLSKLEVAELEQMRDNLTGKAALQISNILCFYQGICQEIDWLKEDEGKFQVETNSPFMNMVGENRYKVFPNPSSNKYTIEGSVDLRLSKIKIFNPMGLAIAAEFLYPSNSTIEIDLGQNQKGIYFLQITNDIESVETIRLLKY